MARDDDRTQDQRHGRDQTGSHPWAEGFRLPARVQPPAGHGHASCDPNQLADGFNAPEDPEFYGEWYPTLSFGRLADRTVRGGPVRNVALIPVTAVTAILTAAAKQRLSDGSDFVFSGAPLVSGELHTGPEPDWSFTNDIVTIELQLEDPPRSRTIRVGEHDGKLTSSPPTCAA